MQQPDPAKTVPATERRPTTCPLPGDEDGAHVPAGRSDSNPGRARCVCVFQVGQGVSMYFNLGQGVSVI